MLHECLPRFLLTCLLLAAFLRGSPAAAQEPPATIHEVAIEGRMEEVERLLDSGVDLELRDENGKTALYLAAREGHEPLVRLLLERGAEVDALTDAGVTPLHTAANGGHLEVMRLLLDHGADVGAMGPAAFGTPLHQAAMSGSVETVRLLIERGADVEARDRTGATAYHRAGDWEVGTLLRTEADRAEALARQARSLYGEGRYARATSLAREALAIREEILGENHPHVAVSLNDLAALLQTQGEFEAARPLYERALVIRERALGPTHPEVAFSLQNLGVLLGEQGDLQAARPLYERSIEILEGASGQDLNVAAALVNLGDLLRLQGEYEAARPRFERSLMIRERALGPDHPRLLGSLNGLASVFRAEGDYETARALYERAVGIAEKNFGSDHRDVARLLYNLADLMMVQEDHEAARPLLERSLAVLEEALGPDHPTVGENLLTLALALEAQGNHAEARRLAERAARLHQNLVDRVLPTLSVTEQRHLVDLDLPQVTNLLLSTHGEEDALATAYGFFGGWKGILLRELRQQRGLRTLAGDPEHSSEVARLRELRTRVAQALHASDPALSDLTAAKEDLERSLAAALPHGDRKDPWRGLGVQGLQEELPEDAAFVDLYRHAPVEGAGYGGSRYSAVVLTPESLRLIDLGESSALERSLDIWRSEVTGGGGAHSSTEALVGAAWNPIAEALPAGTRRVWISPDGALVRAPWATLAGERSGTGDLLVAQVPSGRALLTLLTVTPEEPNDPTLLLVGGVDFGKEEGSFDPLPGTRTEVEALTRIAAEAHVEPLLLQDSDPTAAVVADALSAATYAHLATHGFFYGESEAVHASRGLEIAGGVGSTPQLSRNPLAESGLALAGANAGGGEGTLTAEELVGLDLSGTHLVTLSACETGRGAEVTGQGVLGLQASFTAAGARTLLMSLWSVPDESTATLMEAFYRGLWEERMSPVEALRRAQAEVRSRPGWELPVHWAAWVLSGDAFGPREAP